MYFYVFNSLALLLMSGSVDLDTLRQQTNVIQEELHLMKPKMLEQFSFISKEVKQLQKTLIDVKDQLSVIELAYQAQHYQLCSANSPTETDNSTVHRRYADKAVSVEPHCQRHTHQVLLESPTKQLYKTPVLSNQVTSDVKQNRLMARLYRQNATEDSAIETF